MKYSCFRLDEVAGVISGSTPSTIKKEYYGGNILWATPKDLSGLDDIYIEDTEKKITVEGYKSCSTALLPAGAVLFSSRAPIGLIAIAKHEICTNQGFKNFVCDKDKLSSEYLYYCLRFYRPMIQGLGRGATFAEVSKELISSFKIPVPPLKKQKEIASLLIKVEQLIKKRRQTLRLAGEFLKSVFLEMFGEPGANAKDFKTKSIKELVKKVFNEDPKRYPDKSYSYVDISSVDNQLKRIVKTTQILGSDAPSRARQLLQAQDILVSTVRPNLNAVGILPHGLSNPIGSTGFCVLRANREFARPEYLFEICKTPFFIKSLVNVAKGASYPAVSDSDILRLSIPVPSLPEQQKFADLVKKIEKLKEKQKQSETQLQNLFNSLMQRAFKGGIFG